MTKLLTISNNGPEILETNYWQTELAEKGYFYLSWNAGAARLLVPIKQYLSLEEMRTGKFVTIEKVVEQATPALRIIFDDKSEYPYSILLDARQCDREISGTPGKKFNFSIWTKDGKQLELPGHFI